MELFSTLLTELKVSIFQQFEENFSNDKFSANHEIDIYYNDVFKESVTQFIDIQIVAKVIEKYLVENPEIHTTFTEVPQFLKIHYDSKAFEYITEDLLPEFHKKFSLPKEEEWEEFLDKYMPIYKDSSK